MATTWAVLLPSRGPAPSSALAAFLALGAFLAALVFLVALALAGAPLAACAPPLAFLSDFGFAGCVWGVAASPRPWMDSQMRPAATLAVLKLFTGFTPGRLFQMATRRSAGQPAASAARSFWLAKESKGVVVVAAASSWVPNAVMLFWSSIVNVFISCLLGATLCAVMDIHHSDLLEKQGNSVRSVRPPPATKKCVGRREILLTSRLPTHFFVAGGGLT